MTKRHALKIIELYRQKFLEMGVEAVSCPEDEFPESDKQELQHLHGMLDRMVNFVLEDRMEKFNRWIGFIQEPLWKQRIYTLKELKMHNSREYAEPDTGLIKIIKTPAGEAPLEIREVWVDMILPCGPILGYSGGPECGVLSEESTQSRYSFSVPQEEAIAILERKSPETATWWREHGFPHDGQYFGFAEEEAEIIEGVTPQRIILVTEEMMGDPNR